MFDRTNLQPGANRPGDGTFGKMLFGGSGHRNAFRPLVVPAMESIASERATEGESASPCLEACSLAMVYSPAQEWRALYPVSEAIRKGTLFTELDKPFRGKTLLDR